MKDKIKEFFCKHHWHEVPDSMLLIPNPKTTCTKHIYIDDENNFFLEFLYECCKCKKIKKHNHPYIAFHHNEDLLLEKYPTKRKCRNAQQD